MSKLMHRFTVTMQQVEGFEFKVHFDKEHYEDLYVDEPPPIGGDEAPNAARILAAAMGNCLSASLMFCMKRKGRTLNGMTAEVEMEIVRNEQRRLRVGHVDVKLHPAVDADDEVLATCRDVFEDFCIVTQSVREGIDVAVRVEPTGAVT
jgi:uncharacterized OsmC-like protein